MSDQREPKRVTLAKLVRQAFDRDDEAAMRLFGSNTAQALAHDVERETDPPDPFAGVPDLREVRVLRLRPGDIVLLHTKTQLTCAQSAAIAEQLEAVIDSVGLKGKVRAIVLEPSFSVAVARSEFLT